MSELFEKVMLDQDISTTAVALSHMADADPELLAKLVNMGEGEIRHVSLNLPKGLEMMLVRPEGYEDIIVSDYWGNHEQSPYMRFALGGIEWVSQAKNLMKASLLKQNKLKAGEEVRIKGKGVMKGRVVGRVSEMWLVEFNHDIMQRHLFSESELDHRRKAWVAPKPMASRGYVKFYIDHVQQANLGADLDVLRGASGDVVTRDLH